MRLHSHSMAAFSLKALKFPSTTEIAMVSWVKMAPGRCVTHLSDLRLCVLIIPISRLSFSPSLNGISRSQITLTSTSSEGRQSLPTSTPSTLSSPPPEQKLQNSRPASKNFHLRAVTRKVLSTPLMKSLKRWIPVPLKQKLAASFMVLVSLKI